MPVKFVSVHAYIYIYIYTYKEGAKKCIHILRKEKTVLNL